MKLKEGIGTYLKESNPTQRMYLHEEVYKRMAADRGMDVETFKKEIKEKNNLVVHECLDCKTVVLIPREIHAIFDHYGGVAANKDIYKIFGLQ